MSFTANIPQSGQTLGQTRQEIQDNFTNYNTVVSVDHVAPNSLGQGKHKQSTYPSQGNGFGGSKKSPATLINEVAIYSAADTSANIQLFSQKANQAVDAGGIQLSRLDTGTGINTQNGWSFLPGGIILQWGIGQFVGAASNVNILFVTSNINFTANCFNVSLTGIGFNNTFDVTNVTTTGFTASRSLGTFGANQQFFWTAIGN